MKIKDLIEELKAYPPEKEIHLSIDPEGNQIRTIQEVAQDENEMVIIWPTDTIIEDTDG